MAVLKQTSPTAEPVAPKPKPSSTVPSASTSNAVGTGSDQPESVVLFMSALLNRAGRPRQSRARARSAAADGERRPEVGKGGAEQEVEEIPEDIASERWFGHQRPHLCRDERYRCRGNERSPLEARLETELVAGERQQVMDRPVQPPQGRERQYQ